MYIPCSRFISFLRKIILSFGFYRVYYDILCATYEILGISTTSMFRNKFRTISANSCNACNSEVKASIRQYRSRLSRRVTQDVFVTGNKATMVLSKTDDGSRLADILRCKRLKIGSCCYFREKTRLIGRIRDSSAVLAYSHNYLRNANVVTRNVATRNSVTFPQRL